MKTVICIIAQTRVGTRTAFLRYKELSTLCLKKRPNFEAV